MRIVEIRERTISLGSEIRNASISFAEMDTSAVALISDVIRDGRPLIGFGFNSNGRYAADGPLRRVIPRLLAAEPESLLATGEGSFDPARIWDVMMRNEKPGGHGERSLAVGAIDMAVFDLVAKVDGKPLHRYLAERYRDGSSDATVPVYAAGGYYYPGKDLRQLQDEMRSYLASGYTTVKMKIGGASIGEDRGRIEAALEVVGDGSRLAVDANGRFDLATALTYAEALQQYSLMWFEEAGDPLDFELQAQLAAAYEPPLATGENLFSHQDVRNLLRYGGMRPARDVVQVDPALSYGLVEYLRVLDVLSEHGWSSRRCIPHGGHQFALHIAAGLGLGGSESYPGVFAPVGGFADDAEVVDGRMAPGEAPGIGIEERRELFEVFKEMIA